MIIYGTISMIVHRLVSFLRLSPLTVLCHLYLKCPLTCSVIRSLSNVESVTMLCGHVTPALESRSVSFFSSSADFYKRS